MSLDVPRGALVIEDGPQSPRDDESAREVAIRGGERVGCCSGLQEETRRDKGNEQRETPNF